MLNHARNMREDATYWAPLPPDHYGKIQFAAPVPVKVRWERKAVLFRSNEGVELTSTAVVYCAVPLQAQGRIFLGTSAAADPTSIADTFEIRQVAESPDLTQTRQLTKVFL